MKFHWICLLSTFYFLPTSTELIEKLRFKNNVILYVQGTPPSEEVRKTCIITKNHFCKKNQSVNAKIWEPFSEFDMFFSNIKLDNFAEEANAYMRKKGFTRNKREIDLPFDMIIPVTTDCMPKKNKHCSAVSKNWVFLFAIKILPKKNIINEHFYF